MSKLAIFIADGCEEIEALTVVDIVRRGKIDIDTVAIGNTTEVTSSHRVTFICDKVISDFNSDEYDGVILPGGMPGTEHLRGSSEVGRIVREFHAAGKLVGAICAAPSVLGDLGVLDGKKATCHPGFEERLGTATFVTEPVVIEKNIITSRGMGTAIVFGLAIVDYITGDSQTADHIAEGLVYKR